MRRSVMPSVAPRSLCPPLEKAVSTNFLHSLRSIASISLLALCNIAFAETSTPASNICISKGYTMGFFNGVWNTAQAANDGSRALRRLRSNPDTYRNEPVSYEVFYNHTGSTVGASPLQDLAETFEQRAVEIDRSGELAKRWEFFWENLNGGNTLTAGLTKLFPSAASLFSQLATAMQANSRLSRPSLVIRRPRRTTLPIMPSSMCFLPSVGSWYWPPTPRAICLPTTRSTIFHRCWEVAA
jgi:hypothetical protein